MGKNLYETPRDKGKWNVKNDVHEEKNLYDASQKKNHIEELRARFKKNKKG